MCISTPSHAQLTGHRTGHRTEWELRGGGKWRQEQGQFLTRFEFWFCFLVSTVDSVHCSDFRFLWQCCLFRSAPSHLSFFLPNLSQLCISLDVCMFAKILSWRRVINKVYYNIGRRLASTQTQCSFARTCWQSGVLREKMEEEGDLG